MSQKTIIISLGGSLIVPDQIDVKFLKNFRKLIFKLIKKGGQVIIVCGGGRLCRKYNEAAKSILPKVSREDLDWLGIKATKLNTELIRIILGQAVYHQVIDNPTKKIRTGKRILLGAGWRPGFSTDKVAVLLAKTFRASVVINITNVDYIYDKDPRRHKKAKPLKHISWAAYKKIVGPKWLAGANLPFDPVAARLAEKIGLRVFILNGRDLKNLKNLLEGGEFKGTVIG